MAIKLGSWKWCGIVSVVVVLQIFVTGCGTIISRGGDTKFGKYPYGGVGIDGLGVCAAFAPDSGRHSGDMSIASLGLMRIPIFVGSIVSLPIDFCIDTILLPIDLVAWGKGYTKNTLFDRSPPKPQKAPKPPPTQFPKEAKGFVGIISGTVIFKFEDELAVLITKVDSISEFSKAENAESLVGKQVTIKLLPQKKSDSPRQLSHQEIYCAFVQKVGDLETFSVKHDRRNVLTWLELNDGQNNRLNTYQKNVQEKKLRDKQAEDQATAKRIAEDKRRYAVWKARELQEVAEKIAKNNKKTEALNASGKQTNLVWRINCEPNTTDLPMPNTGSGKVTPKN